MFDPDIAPSGTLLGLLQRGRGDGTLHALAAPRAEALAALNDSVLRDPRRDWQVENPATAHGSPPPGNRAPSTAGSGSCAPADRAPAGA